MARADGRFTTSAVAVEAMGIAVGTETPSDRPLAFDGAVRPINVGSAALVTAGTQADQAIIHVVTA